MRYVTVKVTRDTQTANSIQIAPWEIPVLEYIFEAGNVEVDEDSGQPADERGYPDAGEEFGRLMKVYGSDTKSGIPHAVSVFGEGRRGLNALRALIDEAKQQESAAKPRHKPATARKSKAAYADPLLA